MILKLKLTISYSWSQFFLYCLGSSSFYFIFHYVKILNCFSPYSFFIMFMNNPVPMLPFRHLQSNSLCDVFFFFLVFLRF
uniref:Uncharacterized protein n=1 Tax=Rhizophora mucronata TaxID=61149 RepID=A0A2P2PC37_RHIMU